MVGFNPKEVDRFVLLKVLKDNYETLIWKFPQSTKLSCFFLTINDKILTRRCSISPQK